MVICNRERVKTIESSEIDSDLSFCKEKQSKCCDNLLENPDIIDIRTDMDRLSFYEKTDIGWPCEDVWLIANEECLWQCIVGEVKTPYGVLSNSIGQAKYGCKIWDLLGQRLDSNDVREFEIFIIETCLKYSEVRNVTNIETKIADDVSSLLCYITIDSIYGVFDGEIRIPNVKPSRKNWISSKKMFHRGD